MPHTNVSIDTYGSNEFDQERVRCSAKEFHLIKAELEYYVKKSQHLAGELLNIPEAVAEYGYVDVEYGSDGKKITLVEKK